MLARASTLLALSLSIACAAPRTIAATAPGAPVAFDPAGSDAKAIEVADGVLAAAGGLAAWNAAKELAFGVKVVHDGKTVVDGKHVWDRWNGRHRYVWSDPNGNEVVAMYELYTDVGTATVDGQNVATESRTRILGEARKRWTADSYMLFMPLKLKDPGVHLAYVEERADEGQTTPKWDVIKVTFDDNAAPLPGAVYYVLVNRETKLVDVVEYVAAGKADDQRIGYRWEEWKDVGGLKVSTRRQNIGYAGEQILFDAVEVHASPDEDHYVPVLR